MDSDRMDEPRREGALADTLERVSGKLVTGMVIGSAIVGLAIYSRPGPPRYQLVAAPGGEILRMDSRKGSIISCAPDNKCYVVLKSGQRLTSGRERKALPAPAAALPAPASALPSVPEPAAVPAKR
ncbi:MAG TPA: hypothetical protein VHM92_00190 [Allosphingosinicella sp.]|nr:hypothetical protein [Allosphingosinicella sp.]